ncbi:hypothetical protein NDU88_006291 [Pleurodeles waltl]|uniref:Uncharacterized protein n=1 Tax=Pleurodeles waltl TaxID=8319 RepID=A0AAV7WD15_PLEWA|nr:hypothetical protein NDU88_006291 [Pleurodeles waltl]
MGRGGEYPLREDVPETTEDEGQKKTMGQGHRGERRVSSEKMMRERETGKEDSHVPGGAWLTQSYCRQRPLLRTRYHEHSRLFSLSALSTRGDTSGPLEGARLQNLRVFQALESRCARILRTLGVF